MNTTQISNTETDLSPFIVKIAGDHVERKLVSLTTSNAVIGGLNKKIRIGDMIKFVFYISLLEKNVPVYIKGNAIKQQGDEVTIEYDAPVKSWSKILETLSVNQ